MCCGGLQFIMQLDQNIAMLALLVGRAPPPLLPDLDREILPFPGFLD